MVDSEKRKKQILQDKYWAMNDISQFTRYFYFANSQRDFEYE